MKIPKCFVCALVSVVLVGCASVPADRGGSVSIDLLKSRSTLVSSSLSGGATNRDEVTSIISKPISADDAVRLALLQNPRIHNLYSELGFAQADIYDATRLSNPVLGYVGLKGSGGTQTTWSISQSFTELLFLGYRTRVGRSQLLQSQQRVANEVLAVEAEVRAQFYRAVGTSLITQLRVRTAEAAKLSAQYAQQLYDAGNISALQLSREQAAASTAEINQRRASTDELAARGELMNLMGLSLTDSRVKLVDQLSLPSAFKLDVQELQSFAMTNRLDLVTAREAMSMWEASVKHNKYWRWMGGLSIGAESEHDADGNTITGPSASLELPLFNQGGSRMLRAQASLELEMSRVAALELSIANDIVVRHAALKAAAANVEQYRTHVVPLNEKILELTQQRQSFMLIGAFELLAAKQQEIDAYQAYLESVRDYWIEHAALMRVAGGNLPISNRPISNIPNANGPNADETQGVVGVDSGMGERP